MVFSNMIRLAMINLVRRPLRTALTAAGLGIAIAVLGCLLAFGDDYHRALYGELDRMGMQLMLVPLGCPYDAAARVIKGHTLENSLPEDALAAARRDPAVAVAAPLLMAAVPRPDQGRTDLWVGINPDAVRLKPWWKIKTGQNWFSGDDSVILGTEAAAVEMRQPGDKLFSPETGRTLRVAGVLERSGMSDDSLFFVPLRTAQSMFGQERRLTAVAIRLRDPTLMGEASERLQKIPGAQVVTLAEMMGTFLNLMGAVQTLLLAIGLIALVASALSVFNTLFGSVMEQTGELSLMRVLGASRAQIFALVLMEALLLAATGSLLGLVIAAAAGRSFEGLVRQWVPLAPTGPLLALTGPVALECLVVGIGVGVLGCLFPAWWASRLRPSVLVRTP